VNSEKYIGLDVHHATISVAATPPLPFGWTHSTALAGLQASCCIDLLVERLRVLSPVEHKPLCRQSVWESRSLRA
jgi:hypothetical protein